MPVYTYKCKKCGAEFDILHKSVETMGKVACEKCGSSSVEKMLSAFSVSNGHGGALNNIPSSCPSCCSGGACSLGG